MTTWQSERGMTAQQYVQILKQLKLSKSAAGRYLGVSVRTSFRYADGTTSVPISSALLLRVLWHYRIRPEVPSPEGRKGQ